ncbi:hypothetical protein DLM_0413 [Aquitalea magnusonii]|uniref:Uncharacterized protein n=1 Tax=Aquitalea magnusonii TaxID=332411 RepID=A0A3G9G958_9NEIS|nr:hypothetical protein DLM_0413 [Aquitalea magnusonii]
METRLSGDALQRFRYRGCVFPVRLHSNQGMQFFHFLF